MYPPKNNLRLPAVLLSVFVLPTLVLLAPSTCFAERADNDMPVNMEADQVLIDDIQQISTFTGNVRLSQGTLLIRGDKIVVTQDKEGFKHATAHGKPAEFRQKREGLEGYVEGYAERIEYDTQAETLNLFKQARLKRDQDEVRGEHITYNAKTEIFQVNGSSASSGVESPQRVRAVLHPKPKEDGASKPAPTTPSATPGNAPAPAK